MEEIQRIPHSGTSQASEATFACRSTAIQRLKGLFRAENQSSDLDQFAVAVARQFFQTAKRLLFADADALGYDSFGSLDKLAVFQSLAQVGGFLGQHLKL